MPTMYDLPSENPEEPGLPDDFHALQAMLLLLTFQPLNWAPEMVYSQFDSNIYYDVNHPLWYKLPDWFGSCGSAAIVSRARHGFELCHVG